MDVVKENMKLVVEREEEAEEMAGWRQVIGCDLPGLRGMEEK